MSTETPGNNSYQNSATPSAQSFQNRSQDQQQSALNPNSGAYSTTTAPYAASYQQSYPMSYATDPQQASGNVNAAAAAAAAAASQRPYLGYPDQYQQYLQSVQQMGTTSMSGMPASNPYQQNPYSYYMMNQQQQPATPQQVPPQQSAQAAQQQQQATPQSQHAQQAQPDYSSYAYRGYMQNYPPSGMYPAQTAGGSAPANPYGNPVASGAAAGLSSSVGQIQPAGLRPRITTTMWEDEKTLCYQVDANGISVVRRADNNMINGTKLLNVAKMTRGRRDGILKSEKIRKVVKIGSMHLKGVWIPFERALAMAQREGIVDLLYPLFVKDIKRVIQQGTPTTAALNGSSSSNGVSGGSAAGASSAGASANSASSAGAGAGAASSATNSAAAGAANGSIQQHQSTNSTGQANTTPYASASTLPLNNYSNMYYPSQLSSSNTVSSNSGDKLDGSKDKHLQQQQQPQQAQQQYSGYYQQPSQQAQAPSAQQAQQPYYYYPTQIQQPYVGAYSGYQQQQHPQAAQQPQQATPQQASQQQQPQAQNTNSSSNSANASAADFKK